MKNNEAKKIIIVIMAVLIAAIPLYAAGKTAENGDEGVAEEETKEIVYDVYSHRETSENIFMAIGGLSIGSGIGLTVNGNRVVRGIGWQNILWGLAETGLAMYQKNWADRGQGKEALMKKIENDSGSHIWFDIGAVAAGSVLLIFGNDDIKGHGAGIMIQGTLLTLYDTMNLVIVQNPERVKDWASPSGWNIYCGLSINP